MLQAIGITKEGVQHLFQERTSSALEHTAERLGVVRFEYDIDGGKVVLRKLGNEWVWWA